MGVNAEKQAVDLNALELAVRCNRLTVHAALLRAFVLGLNQAANPAYRKEKRRESGEFMLDLDWDDTTEPY